jgi:flagellar hook-basal body complex protein FliE
MDIAKLGAENLVALAMKTSDPRHMTQAAAKSDASGAALAALGKSVGADAVVKAGTFEDAMLQAMDAVNADQLKVTDLEQQMVVDPESVDAHDVTIAMAEANLSLNITRTVLDRIVKGWKEIINTR